MQNIFYVDGDEFKVSHDGEWITLVIAAGEVVNHVNPFSAWSLAIQLKALETLTNK